MIPGQMTIFDMVPRKERRPCDYRFKRYIGQRVRFYRWPGEWSGVYRITAIFPYYTYVKNWKGEELVGTPTTIGPVDKSEYEDDY